MRENNVMQVSDDLLRVHPLYPFRFAPIYKDYLWGGARLRTRFGRTLPQEGIAESWEIVDRPQDESVVVNGPLRGRRLNEFVQHRCTDLFGTDFVACHNPSRFPLILKYLDARLPLSVQVHPDDATTVAMGLNDYGKTETWIIVDAEPGSKLWIGTNRNYPKAELENAFQSGELERCLNEVPAKIGDCFFIPPGTLHALGAGIMVAEVQTNSDVTFRLFDWNRVGPDGKPRELKVAEAMRSLVDPCIPVLARPAFPTAYKMCECLLIGEPFTLNRWTLTDPFVWKNDAHAHLWTVLDGTATVIFNAGRRTSPQGQSGREGDPDAIEVLSQGDSILVPAMCSNLRWIVESGHQTTLLDILLT